MRTSRETRAFLLLTLVTLVWAGLMPTGKIALQSVPPLTIGAIRLTIGSCLLRLYMGRNPAHHVQWGSPMIGSFALLGLVGYLIGVGCSYYGLRLTTVTNAALLNAAAPVSLALLSFVFLKERLSARATTGYSALGYRGQHHYHSRFAGRRGQQPIQPRRFDSLSDAAQLGRVHHLRATPDAPYLPIGRHHVHLRRRRVLAHCRQPHVGVGPMEPDRHLALFMDCDCLSDGLRHVCALLVL